MAFYPPVDGFFGNCKGVFSPLGGSAFVFNNRQIVISKLLSASMELLLKEEGVTSFAMSQYANDIEVASTFALNGFGIRCSDAIMRLQGLKPRKPVNASLRFKELKSNEKELILDLRKELTMHLLKSPTYFPTHIGKFMDWFSKEEIRVFVACEKDEIIGFMSIQEEAETFISKAAGIVNICGAFVKEEYRGKNVATDLLYYVCEVCEMEGAEYLGVDCETLNPNALRFWGKYFKNYTFSYHRRIDERIIGYESYLEKEWK
jgi:GNAT superfamily N-acetyltransferase